VDKAVAAGLDRSGGHFYRGRLLLARAEQQEQVAEAERELRAGLAEFPNYRNAHVWLGEALMKMRQFDSARRALREALRLNPSNGSAAVGLAMVAHQSGDDAEKDKYLAMAAKLVPTHPWVREQLMLLAEEKDPKTTIERRQAHRKNKPEDLDNLLTLAELYVKVGEQEKAREVFGECRRLRPDDVIVAQHYARFLRSRQPPELEAAEEMLRKLAEAIDPKEGTKKAAAQLLLAGHLRTVAEEGGRETPREKWDQVDAAHEAAAALSDVAEVRLDIGNYFLQTRRYKKVEEWARKAIAAIEKNGRPEHHQRGPRRMLIDAMIRTRDSRRREEIEREIEAYRALFPDDPSASVMLGQLYAAIGPDRQAFEQFTDYIQKAPQEAAGYFRRGLLYLRRSRWDEAIKDLREVKRVDPSFADYEARLLLAQALENSGQTDAAITELRSVLEEDSSLLSVVRNLLTIYARLERWDAAESLIAPRAEAEPDNPVWPRLRAELASERGRPGPAVTFAREAVEKSEFDPDVVDFFLVTCLKHERYDELIAFVNDQLKPEQRNALVQLRLGGAYAAKEDTVRAIECYARSLEAEDARLDTFMDVIWDGVRRLDPDAVREAASKRLESQPQERASKLILLMVHRRKGDRDAFIRSLKEVAEAVPADTPKDKWEKILLMRELALAMHGSEHAQEARDTYNKILELHPNDPVALNNLAYLLMNELQDPKSARRYAERALEGAPENAGVLDTLGWNLVLLGEYDEAIRKLRHALEIQSELDALHYHLAEALFRRSGTAGANQKGDLNEAEAECRRAHELIMKTGRDPEGILDDVVALGEKLGLSLEKNLPAAGQTP